MSVLNVVPRRARTGVTCQCALYDASILQQSENNHGLTVLEKSHNCDLMESESKPALDWGSLVEKSKAQKQGKEYAINASYARCMSTCF